MGKRKPEEPHVRIPRKKIPHIYDVGPDAFTVWVVILNHINKDGLAWPGVSRISEQTGISARQVRYCFGVLEKHGWIKITRRTGHANVYQISTAHGAGPQEGGLHSVQDHPCTVCSHNELQLNELFEFSSATPPEERDVDSSLPRLGIKPRLSFDNIELDW